MKLTASRHVVTFVFLLLNKYNIQFAFPKKYTLLLFLEIERFLEKQETRGRAVSPPAAWEKY